MLQFPQTEQDPEPKQGNTTPLHSRALLLLLLSFARSRNDKTCVSRSRSRSRSLSCSLARSLTLSYLVYGVCTENGTKSWHTPLAAHFPASFYIPSPLPPRKCTRGATNISSLGDYSHRFVSLSIVPYLGRKQSDTTPLHRIMTFPLFPSSFFSSSTIPSASYIFPARKKTASYPSPTPKLTRN